MNWIEIFRAGEHTDSAGRTRTWTRSDIDHMVKSYEPARHEAPLVFGHPKDNDPAFGWVEQLKRDGDLLLASFKQVPDAVKDLVGKGLYKKRSIRVFKDGRLCHVGLLGAAAPAVEGLKEIGAFEAGGEFSEIEVDFSTAKEAGITWEGKEMTLEEAQKQLEEEKRKREEAEGKVVEANKRADKAESSFTAAEHSRKRAELEARADDYASKEKAILLPAEKARFIAFAEALDGATEIEFAAGEGKKPLQQHFFEFLEARGKHNLFHEFTAPEDGSGAGAGSSAANQGLYQGLTKCV